jgi:hypothetical protein
MTNMLKLFTRKDVQVIQVSIEKPILANRQMAPSNLKTMTGSPATLIDRKRLLAMRELANLHTEEMLGIRSWRRLFKAWQGMVLTAIRARE